MFWPYFTALRIARSPANDRSKFAGVTLGALYRFATRDHEVKGLEAYRVQEKLDPRSNRQLGVAQNIRNRIHHPEKGLPSHKSLDELWSSAFVRGGPDTAFLLEELARLPAVRRAPGATSG